MKQLTVYIVHYRKLPQLKATVDALRRNTTTAFDLKVLNQGYTGGGIAGYLDQLEAEGAEVIRHPRNVGCSPGRRLLSSRCRTPFLLSLDDDMYVSPAWDRAPMALFAKDHSLGAVGFMLSSPDGTSVRPGGKSLDVQSGVVRNRPVPLPTTTQAFIPADHVSAGAMLYRRTLHPRFEWDPAYFIGFDDLDKGMQFCRDRVRCLVSLCSRFVHDKVSVRSGHEGYNSARRDMRELRRSYLHFVDKWHVRYPLARHLYYTHLCGRVPDALLLPLTRLKLTATGDAA